MTHIWLSYLWYTNLVYGERWTGKTYYFVRIAKELQKQGYIIISNLWLSFKHIRFRTTKQLAEIMREIAEYNDQEVVPMVAPKNFLKELWIEKKRGIPLNFFILHDEIWIHMNHRKWQKNFATDEILLDMIMEPRKYWVTYVGICQEWRTVDLELRVLTKDWFSVQRKYGWRWFLKYFDRTLITQYKVYDGVMSANTTFKVGKLPMKWNYFEHKKDFTEHKWWLYFDREVSGAGASSWLSDPNSYQKWAILSLIQTVPEKSERSEVPEAPAKGVEPVGEEYTGSGASPENNNSLSYGEIWSASQEAKTEEK